MNSKITKPFFWLILTAFAIILSGCQTRAERFITQTYPNAGETLSAFGWVGVSFIEPMNQASVEKVFTLTPPVEGEIFWQDNTFWFRPIIPFSQDTVYQAQLAGDLETSNDRKVRLDLTWDFTIRQPDLIYFVPFGDGGEIWRASVDGSDPRQLSNTGGNVFEFAPERSGASIAYSVQNELGGRDLWLMDRNGENQRMLLNCNNDVCGESTWSMDRKRIAYVREVFDPKTAGYLPAQVWTAEVSSSETAQLYQSEIAFGHSPSFSPDGEKLATYDTTQNAIRVLNLQTSQESAIPRILPGSGDWSREGTKILFTDLLPAENEPFVEIYIADLAGGTVDTAFNEPSTDTDFSQPRWSPDGEWLAVSLRPVNTNFTKALWLLSLNGDMPINIAADPSANHSAYRWDPWGEALVYQRLALGGFETGFSIWYWDWDTQQAVQILDTGARPHWLH